ncbi:MAG: alpha-L-fucosidase [Spirochaetales bacterium]|nr:alpha-L-fucosidase [Spirochaetales bacterium]
MRLLFVFLLACVSFSCMVEETAPPIDDRNYSSEELDILKSAGHIKPSSRQLEWQKDELTAFFHFGINTFTGREWGNGEEDPNLFQPSNLDTDQWIKTIKDAGFKLAILTAKHHDGFCLWQSDYTDHDLGSTSWMDGKGDVLRDFVDSCRKYGIRVGVYISPWDRNQSSYGSDEYNTYFKNQLTEVLENYGPFDEVWFDGACGEGPNGKKQIYDWEGYYRIIREFEQRYNKNCVIAVSGPDVRWVGNESGLSRFNEWSVLPVHTLSQDDVQQQFEGYHFEDITDEERESLDLKNISRGDGTVKDLGSRSQIISSVKGGMDLTWYPAEADVSIRPGWFYHSSQDSKVKSLSHLLHIYYYSVGRNSNLLLNFPPDKRGLVHENDASRIKEFGDVIRSTFKKNLAEEASIRLVSGLAVSQEFSEKNIIDGDLLTFFRAASDCYTPSFELSFESPVTFNRVMLQENIAEGQRIERCEIEFFENGSWVNATTFGSVGYKRILKTKKITTDRVRIKIIQSRSFPELVNFGLFLADPRDR